MGVINLIGFATCKGVFCFSDEYDSAGNLMSTFDSCPNRDAIAVTFPKCTLYNLRTGDAIARYDFSLSKRYCNISGATYVPLGSKLEVIINGKTYTQSVYTG